jgi:DmpG-like communication domain/IclR helix-turn-helix domain/HMGL-like
LQHLAPPFFLLNRRPVCAEGPAHALFSFTPEQPEWGVRELSSHLGWPRSTTHLLLSTLASEGFLMQSSDRRYRLGWTIFELGSVFLSGLELREKALPVMRLDGCLRGLGAGAGNAPTELLATVLDKMGLNPGLDVYKLMDAAEFVIAPMMPFQPMPNREAITIGYAGVYSTFLLHAQRAGERYSIDPRTILTELGRRQAVAGQEDWILDVALELARDSQVHPPIRHEGVETHLTA